MNAENPPTRFTDAERINPYRVLDDLYSLHRPVPPTQDSALAELALAAAVVSWWSRWQPLMIHKALQAGANLADIAAATGLDADEVVRRWREWTDVQATLVLGGRPAVDPDEVRTITARLGPELSP
jgi:hypothetical protein